jgi:hypothetical protein
MLHVFAVHVHPCHFSLLHKSAPLSRPAESDKEVTAGLEWAHQRMRNAEMQKGRRNAAKRMPPKCFRSTDLFWAPHTHHEPSHPQPSTFNRSSLSYPVSFKPSQARPGQLSSAQLPCPVVSPSRLGWTLTFRYISPIVRFLHGPMGHVAYMACWHVASRKTPTVRSEF